MNKIIKTTLVLVALLACSACAADAYSYQKSRCACQELINYAHIKKV